MTNKERFIGSYQPWGIKDTKNFLADLNEILIEAENEGIERGKIIERHGSESYIE